MVARVASQLALDERMLEDDRLEDALEQRRTARAAAALADANARAQLERLDMTEGQAVRVGRFRIERVATPGRSVAFETKPGRRWRISADEG